MFFVIRSNWLSRQRIAAHDMAVTAKKNCGVRRIRLMLALAITNIAVVFPPER
jgi:hypothetical protein